MEKGHSLLAIEKETRLLTSFVGIETSAACGGLFGNEFVSPFPRAGE
jgi:hypothetical protein